MHYTIDKDNFRVREEKNGTISFLNLRTMNIVFLNKTASIIFQHPEINNLESLTKLLMIQYPRTNKDIIEQDCIDLLYRMDALEIISLTDVECKNEHIFVAGDSDFSNISKFIKRCINKDKKVLLCSSIDLNHFSAYAIRVRQFSNLEFNFVHTDENNEIDALITCGTNPGSSAFVITNIFSSKTQIKTLQEIIDYIFKMTKDLTKFRVMLSNILDNDLYQILSQLGFSEEAILRKEYGSQDLICYALFRD